MKIFCYGDKSHIRVHPHIKYFPGAAKNVVTGGKYMIFMTDGTCDDGTKKKIKSSQL